MRLSDEELEAALRERGMNDEANAVAFRESEHRNGLAKELAENLLPPAPKQEASS